MSDTPDTRTSSAEAGDVELNRRERLANPEAARAAEDAAARRLWGDDGAWARTFKSMLLLAELLQDPAFGEGTLMMARNQARIMLNRWNEAVEGGSDAPSAPNRAPTVEALEQQIAELRKVATRPTPPWLAYRAADALEDLTRENERLRADCATLADARLGAEVESDDLRRQIAAVRALCAEVDGRVPQGFDSATWVPTEDVLAALDTASEDRGDSQGAVRDG